MKVSREIKITAGELEVKAWLNETNTATKILVFVFWLCIFGRFFLKKNHFRALQGVGKLVGSTLTNMSVNMIDGDTIEKVQRRGLAIGAWTLFSQDSKWLGVWLSDDEQLEFIRKFSKRDIVVTGYRTVFENTGRSATAETTIEYQ